ncbi:MAG TPA: TonB-dependent receptor [Vicinamibacterales bacterium]|nr:TonB-dependent receptor [Vicinamibacterales bacterium]
MKNSALLLFVVWIGALASPALAQTPADRRIDVSVLDSQGLPIFGAQVTAMLPAVNISRTAVSTTERFSIEALAPAVYTLRVSAPGFQRQDISVDLTAQPSQTVEVRLRAAGPTEQVVVSATRSEQRIVDVPASVNVVTSTQIEQSPAVVADDVLRQIPTFSLFRRTSSIASHPTAQGVSLRGVGPSGVSRTLVLLDQVPFNDPFGGWVYWTRVPLMDTERIEVVDGPTSSLYGNYAMGGVINIVTHRAEPRTIIFKPQYGNRNTPKMDVFASDVWGKLGATFHATTFNTDGYRIVAEEERGTIDIDANVKYNTASGKLDYNPTDRVNLFFRAGIFDEERSNGKIGEGNDTSWKFGSGGVGLRFADGSNVDARIFFDKQKFHSTFFAVPATAVPPRSQINLTLDQVVPTNAVGTMLQWNRVMQAGAHTHVLSAGYDFRWIDGDSNEQTYALATGLTPLLNRISGGTQKIGGLFVQDMIELTGKLQLTGSIRFDSWRNYDAHNFETTIATGVPTANNRELADKSDNAFSPRVAALYRATDRVNVWGSVSNGFRAPTLNELYRQFRVGAVLTLANEELGPERLTGVEAGVSVAATDRITVRGTLFNNRVKDPVANVTTNALGTVRQRQNLGSTNIGGFQTDVSYRVNGNWGLSGAYVFDIAKVHESQADAAGNDLTGKYLAEVPKHRASFQLSYMNPRLVNVSIENQFVGHQFDDDLNTQPIFPNIADKRVVGLPKYSVTNFTVGRTLTRNLDLFIGMQNVLGTTYYVGTNPTTIGTPRLVNGGVRLKVGR